MKIYLLRHGTTDYNTQKRYQGQRDIPLSTRGREALCQADLSPDVVYVSPMTRPGRPPASCSPRRNRSWCRGCGRWTLAP